MKRESIHPMRQMTRLADVAEGTPVVLLGKSLYLAYHCDRYTFLWTSEAAYRRAYALNRDNPPGWLVKAASWSHFVELPAAQD